MTNIHTILHFTLSQLGSTYITKSQQKNSFSMHSPHYNSSIWTLMYAYLDAMEISWLTARGPIYTNELCGHQYVYVHKPSVQVKTCHEGLMAVTIS